MPGRMVEEFSQEVQDFDRQMGCMAGVFQIFDRRRLLTGRQRGGARGTWSAQLPGHTLPGSSMYAPVQNSTNPNITLEKSFSKSMTENSSHSAESSRASSCSSSCSSFSSLDGSKPVEKGLPCINKKPVVGRALRSLGSLRSSGTEAKSKQPSTNFRDVIKDSNRDSHGLAIKTTTMAQRNGLHKDSPRPLLISKSTDGTYVIAIDRSSGLPAYVDESSRQPRFSCDERQLLQQVEAQGSKRPSAKLRELPRLSLDSRKESVRPSSHLKNFGYARTDDSLIDSLKAKESPSHRQASSVIAKLMGLEESIDSYGPVRPPRPAHDNQNDRPSHSPSKLKTKPSPRILPEAAPWRQQERSTTGYYAETRARSASVYDDIERRLRGVELSECNKDLRALRILGGLHAKHTPCQSDTNAKLLLIRKAAAERTTTAQDFQSPIVIMKPARGIARPNASVAPPTRPKVHRNLRHAERPFTGKSHSSDGKKISSHNERAHFRAEKAVSSSSSPKSSRSLRPRLVQKKPDCGRMPRLPVPPRSPTKTSNEAASPRGTLRSRASQANSIFNDDKVLIIPGSKTSLSKQVDTCIIDYANPLNVNTSCIHRSNTTSILNHEETPILSSDKNIHPVENIPSHVSVPDAAFYQDGSSPSLRKISNSFKDGAIHTSDECWNPVSLPDTPPLKSSEGNHIIPENMKAHIQRLELLQLLSDEAPSINNNLSTITTNEDHHYIYEILSASGLLHSELSSGTMPCQFQLPSYPISPELFLILEQAKPTAGKLHRRLIFDLANKLIAQKMHSGGPVSRSVQFLQSKKSSGSKLFKELCMMIERIKSEASMLRFFEEEDAKSVLAEDAVREMGEWKSFDSEPQGMVLDIERSIFKDLIEEVISSDAMGKVQLRQWKINRQLSL
ncbi:protein LONGIFOLIA 1-like [Phragmites australis]|uniref:protein LONGIFOLIA 1-like n=1 Tax=Phragmites australis TaxID=29695 RepID=UPI002D777936|nr:protein LONGIFOLIA 1-like [Phragmites australis]